MKASESTHLFAAAIILSFLSVGIPNANAITSPPVSPSFPISFTAPAETATCAIVTQTACTDEEIAKLQQVVDGFTVVFEESVKDTAKATKKRDKYLSELKDSKVRLKKAFAELSEAKWELESAKKNLRNIRSRVAIYLKVFGKDAELDAVLKLLLASAEKSVKDAKEKFDDAESELRLAKLTVKDADQAVRDLEAELDTFHEAVLQALENQAEAWTHLDKAKRKLELAKAGQGLCSDVEDLEIETGSEATALGVAGRVIVSEPVAFE